MKLIIDIPEDTYERIKALLGTEYLKDNCEYVMSCVANGTPYKERPKGKWIIDGHHIRCNRCNEYICNTDREGNEIPDNFCPNCGVRMER